MSTFRKVLALVLILLMTMQMIAFSLVANDPNSIDEEEVPIVDIEGAYEQDTVIFNLGNQEIIVGYDSERAEFTPWSYRLFNEAITVK